MVVLTVRGNPVAMDVSGIHIPSKSLSTKVTRLIHVLLSFLKAVNDKNVINPAVQILSL